MLANALSAIDLTSRDIPVVLIGEPLLLGAAHDAIAAIGARPVTEIGWDKVASGLPLPGTRALFVVETQGVDEEVLAAALPRIDAAAAALDAPVVVSLGESAIDIVAATLLGSRTHMLCEPDEAERTLALMLAARAMGEEAISDTVYENEAARLKRLNEEVARIADVLSRLTRHDAEQQRRTAAEVNDRQQSFGLQPMQGVAIEAAEIRRAIRGRRMRDQHFGAGLFEEPGWDMMLDLFAAEIERTRVSVSSLCIAAAVAPTTALRWISKLTEAGLFERHPDPFDRRRAYMELSARASHAMREYIGALRRAGLSLA